MSSGIHVEDANHMLKMQILNPNHMLKMQAKASSGRPWPAASASRARCIKYHIVRCSDGRCAAHLVKKVIKMFRIVLAMLVPQHLDPLTCSADHRR